jgi:hypothetical protein
MLKTPHLEFSAGIKENLTIKMKFQILILVGQVQENH